MIRAKAKVRAQRRVAQKELEENSGPLEIRAGYRQPRAANTIPTGELKNVVAETIKRVFHEEYGLEVDDVNAREYYADRVIWAMKFGGWDEWGYTKLSDPIPMKDHDYKRVPRCKAHKR